MKKQILFLAMFTLALIFTGINSYGQTYITVPSAAPGTTTLTPNALDALCSATSALNPSPGQNYNYTVATSGTNNDIRWFVINNEDLKTASPVANIIDPTTGILAINSSYIDNPNGSGKYILALGTANGYNVAPVSSDAASQGGSSIDISWKNFDGKLPHEILLVAFVIDNAGCTNNLVVWRIIPKNTFTLDIWALGANGSMIAAAGATGVGPCVSPIEKANYSSADDANGTGTLTVDYGENWVFFIVNANNFVDSWMPEFEITYNGNTAVAKEAYWTYLQAATSATATWNTIDVTTGLSTVPVIAGGSDATGVPVNAAGDKKVAVAGGEYIVIRVRLDYGTDAENAASRTVVLAVNGVMYDNDNTAGTYYDNRTLFEDLHHVNCLADGFDNDEVTQTITGRPEINNPNPTPLEIKTGDGN